MLPLSAFGIQVVSFAPSSSRASRDVARPDAGKAMREFLYEVEWGPLDYLVIDLPPGTGTSRSASPIHPLTGAVIVTTPQDVSIAT